LDDAGMTTYRNYETIQSKNRSGKNYGVS